MRKLLYLAIFTVVPFSGNEVACLSYVFFIDLFIYFVALKDSLTDCLCYNVLLVISGTSLC